MTAYIQEKGWWRTYRIWILGFLILILGLFIMIWTAIGKPIGDFTKAMIDPSVYHNAFDIVQKDERVIALLGAVQPISFFDLIAGEVRYAEADKAMLSVRIQGAKQKGSMDVVANKKNNKWHYQMIRIRTKKPKKIIEILDSK